MKVGTGTTGHSKDRRPNSFRVVEADRAVRRGGVVPRPGSWRAARGRVRDALVAWEPPTVNLQHQTKILLGYCGVCFPSV